LAEKSIDVGGIRRRFERHERRGHVARGSRRRDDGDAGEDRDAEAEYNATRPVSLR